MQICGVLNIGSNGGLSKLIHIRCNLSGKFSVITFSETWLSDDENSKDYTIQGYQKPFHRYRDGVNGTISYGGVLVRVADNVACKDLELPNLEVMWLVATAKNNKFYLCIESHPRLTSGRF